MNMLTPREKKERISSAAISVGFHVALFFAFLFWQFTVAEPKIEEDGGGILVNFGDSETGLGDIEPTSTETSVPVPTPPQNTTPEKSNDVLTQDTEPAPVISTAKKKKTPKPNDVKTTPTNNPTTATKPVEKPQKPKAIFPGSTTNNSTSQGDNTAGGNKGKTYGDKNTNGNSTIGGGSNPMGKGGPGIGFNLAGRALTQRPAIEDKSQKTGKVVVNIKVDKNGTVISAKATHMGSTTEDSYLYNLAEKAAMQTKFNASADMVEQFGTMTFTFKVK